MWSLESRSAVRVLVATVFGTRSLSFEASYFNIRYRDRVVQPIAGSIAAAFTDPAYALLIDRSPEAGLLGQLIEAVTAPGLGHQ